MRHRYISCQGLVFFPNLQELDQVYRCLAAILFISDVTFIPDSESNDPYTERLVPAEDYPLEAISRLLGVDKQKLMEAFVSSERITNGEW